MTRRASTPGAARTSRTSSSSRSGIPAAKIYKIETNYRSTPEILQRGQRRDHAPTCEQFAKELAPARKAGPKPVMVVCNDAGEQAAFVAQRVLELREEGGDLNKMAVLYRSHFHALELQLELTRRNIPFSITSGIRFFEQAHIKDVTAYLKLVHEPARRAVVQAAGAVAAGHRREGGGEAVEGV